MSVHALITGGAGFIGINLAHRLLGAGTRVTLYDNLSRPGTERNVAWLRAAHGEDCFRLCQRSVTDFEALRDAAGDADVIYHLAGQVAVTASLRDPRTDFEANAIGTFNALEAARSSDRNPIFLFASTNKVYGGLDLLAVREETTRYSFVDFSDGVPETYPLDGHSPYGCSKVAADQYVRDYHRIYGLRTVVLRQSCIYGPRQLGIPDQGWIAWLVIAAIRGHPITIYGDGKQVRDLLFVDDLLDAYAAAVANIDRSAGQAYNIGGGPARSISIWQELGPLLQRLLGRAVPVAHGAWRAGDQRVYISDIGRARRDLGWSPVVEIEDGLERVIEWVLRTGDTTAWFG